MNLDDKKQIYQSRVQIHFCPHLRLPLKGSHFSYTAKLEVGNIKILYAAVFSIFLGIHIGLKSFYFSVFHHVMEKTPTLQSLQGSFLRKCGCTGSYSRPNESELGDGTWKSTF